jgi:hypothetical protein
MRRGSVSKLRGWQRAAGVDPLQGGHLTRGSLCKRASDLSAVGKVLSATEDLIFELDDSAMNKQMRLKFALRTALSLCPTLF